MGFSSCFFPKATVPIINAITDGINHEKPTLESGMIPKIPFIKATLPPVNIFTVSMKLTTNVV